MTDQIGCLLLQRMVAPLPKDHPRTELQEFYDLLADYPSRGGKLLRGRLVLLSCQAHGGRLEDALDVAAALELFQSWVLIHDDIEDDSEERRGSPALHRKAGLPVALNVGDALHVYMWQLLLGLDVSQLARREEILDEFLQLIHRTAEGQHLDLAWVRDGRFDIDEEAYLEMVSLKTAWYTVTGPLRLGALVADRTPDSRFPDIGEALGRAFQIRDDVLNLLPEISYGKEFAGDLYEAKRTLILAHFFGLADPASRREVQNRLAKPRTAKAPEDIDRILELLNRHGSLAYAQEVAEDHARRGLESLQEVLAELPNQRAARDLSELVETLARRNK